MKLRTLRTVRCRREAMLSSPGLRNEDAGYDGLWIWGCGVYMEHVSMNYRYRLEAHAQVRQKCVRVDYHFLYPDPAVELTAGDE